MLCHCDHGSSVENKINQTKRCHSDSHDVQQEGSESISMIVKSKFRNIHPVKQYSRYPDRKYAVANRHFTKWCIYCENPPKTNIQVCTEGSARPLSSKTGIPYIHIQS